MSEFNRRGYEQDKSSPVSSAPGGKAAKRAGVIGGLIVLVILVAVVAWHDSNGKKSGSAELISEGASALMAPLTDGKPQAKPSPAHIDQPDQPAASNPNLQPFTPPSVAQQAGVQPSSPAQTAQAGAGGQQNAFNPNALSAVPGPTVAAGPRMSAKVYHARHKEGLGGGPWGQLTLSANGIQFEGADEHYNFPLDSIASQNADGFILKTGEKYHFRMDGLSKDQVMAEFSDWFQQIGQLKAGQALARAPH